MHALSFWNAFGELNGQGREQSSCGSWQIRKKKDNNEDKVTIEIDDDDVNYLWVVTYEKLNDETISYQFDQLYINNVLQDYDTTQYELEAIFGN